MATYLKERRHTDRRGNVRVYYYAQVPVPKKTRTAVGRRCLVEYIGRQRPSSSELREVVSRLEGRIRAAAAAAPIDENIAGVEAFGPTPEQVAEAREVLKAAGLDVVDANMAERVTLTRLRRERDAVAVDAQALRVSRALERWRAAADGVRAGTMYQYDRDVTAFVEWSKDTAVSSVDEDLAARFWSHLKATPTRNKTTIAPATIKRKVGSLSRLWTWMAARKVHQGPNPWAALLRDAPGEAKGGRTVKGLRAFKSDEIKKYVRAIGDTTSKYARAGADIVTLMWHTGVRPGDLSELTADRVMWDEEERVVWLTLLGDGEDGGKTAANARVLPVVSPEAMAILSRRVDGAGADGKLFGEVPLVKNDYRYFRVQKVINPVLHDALPGEPLDTYSARRSFSAACEDAGLDPVQWSRMMGHTAPTLAAAVYNRGHRGRRLLLEGMRRVHAELGEIGA